MMAAFYKSDMPAATARLWLSTLVLVAMVFLPSLADGETYQEELQTFEEIRAAALNGEPLAQVHLGVRYFAGHGVKKDRIEATKWFRKAADQGFAPAQVILGNSYYFGYGVEKNMAEAVVWYRKAADQGIPDAQHLLGNRYFAGEGVAKDFIEAYAYYRLSPIKLESARRNLETLEKVLTPEDRLRGQKRTKELQKEIEAKKPGK
jgi:TPR repeat protein